jgi:hypothetical protein
MNDSSGTAAGGYQTPGWSVSPGSYGRLYSVVSGFYPQAENSLPFQVLFTEDRPS